MTHKALFLLRHMLEHSALWVHEDVPFRPYFFPGAPAVVVIAGDNCSGKSLLSRTMQGWAHHFGGIGLGMSFRQHGPAQAGQPLPPLYADGEVPGEPLLRHEGESSLASIERAFAKLRQSAHSGKHSLLVLDAPDTGLSAKYAGALGDLLAAHSKALPDPAIGVVITTHSRAMVGQFVRAYGMTPTFVHMGAERTLSDWLTSQDTATVADLRALHSRRAEWKTSVARAIQDIKAGVAPRSAPNSAL